MRNLRFLSLALLSSAAIAGPSAPALSQTDENVCFIDFAREGQSCTCLTGEQAKAVELDAEALQTCAPLADNEDEISRLATDENLIPAKAKGNNGIGNGIQDAPGNSGVTNGDEADGADTGGDQNGTAANGDSAGAGNNGNGGKNGG